MKKIITASVLVFLFAASNLFAVDKLYIVGDAVFGNWNADVAPLMYAEGNDVFTYIGWFNTGGEGFKFIQDDNWGGGYFNANSSATLSPDSPGTLTTDGTGDVKFQMETAGFYKVTCDLANFTITAEAKASNDEQPIMYQALFLVGDATLGVFDLGKAMRINKQDGLVYSGETYLNLGHFKLTLTPYEGFDYDYFLFRDGTDEGKISPDDTDDRQWEITEKGLYAITVNLQDNSIKIEKKNFDKLYVIGGAVDGGWSTGDIPMMNLENTNVFTYTGWFAKADESNPDPNEEFKFIPQRMLNHRFFQIFNGAGSTDYIEIDLEGKGSGTLIPDSEKNGDYKFKLRESGNYKVTCDLNEMKITVEKIAYQDTPIKYAALYMIGTATPDNEVPDDFPTKAVKLTSNGNNTYSATNVDLEVGVFKLLTANDRGWSTTHLFRDKDDSGIISTDGDGDRKWEIAESGNYNITANLATMTISIVKDDGTGTNINSNSNEKNLQVISQNKSIELVLFADCTAETVELVDITGKKIMLGYNMSNCATLAENLQSGIYLVKAVIAGKPIVQKVLVK